MKPQKVTELTTEELNKQKKTLSGVLIGLGSVTLFAYGILLYFVIRDKNFVFLAIIPSGFLTLLPSLIRIGQINTELKSRL